MTVALQFVGNDDLESEIIALGTQGVFSHVDIVMPDDRLLGARSDIIQGIPAGVQIRPPAYEAWKRCARVTLPSNTAQEALFYAFLTAQLGKPYDAPGLISNFLFGRDWREPDSWWCSELAGAALENSSILLYLLATPTNRLSPDGLLLALSAIVPVKVP